jgi:hypothetical protein
MMDDTRAAAAGGDEGEREEALDIDNRQQARWPM